MISHHVQAAHVAAVMIRRAAPRDTDLDAVVDEDSHEVLGRFVAVCPKANWAIAVSSLLLPM